MKQTKIYDFTARMLMLLLGFFFVTVSLRYAWYKLELPGLEEQEWAKPLFASQQESGESAAPEETEAAEETAGEKPPLSKRDRDGIVWGIHVDWSERYPEPPLDEGGEEENFAHRFVRTLNAFRTRVEPFEAEVEALKSELDLFATDYAVGYSEMVELANAYDELLGWEIAGVDSYNPVIETGENYFLTCTPWKDQSARAQESVELAALCRELGMEHLFVETPGKTCREDEANSVTDFYNSNADRLLLAMENGGVKTLDLRENLHAAGMDHHASFFETDHHWKSETGLWAAGEVARTLNERFGFDIDLARLDGAKFEREVYEDWFLGSQGKKVTLSRAEPEDISLLYPDYEVDLSIEIPSLDVSKRGDFSIMYRYAAIDECDYYKLNPYGAFLYGDNAITSITNHADTSGKRVLMLGHSYDNSVVPFLSLGVSQLDAIDLREFTGSLETYLRENQYDVVIELYTI